MPPISIKPAQGSWFRLKVAGLTLPIATPMQATWIKLVALMKHKPLMFTKHCLTAILTLPVKIYRVLVECCNALALTQTGQVQSLITVTIGRGAGRERVGT